MKKMILCVCALMVCALVNAKPMTGKAMKSQFTQLEQKIVAQMQLQPQLTVVDNFKAPLAPQAATEEVNGYYVSPYQWVTGSYPGEGLLSNYVLPAAIFVPFCDSVVYKQYFNYFNTTTEDMEVKSVSSTWTLDDKQVAKNTPYYVQKTGEFEDLSLPSITTNDTTIKGTQYTFPNYQFGATWNKNVATKELEGYLSVGTNRYTLTQAQRYAETLEEGWLPGVSFVPVGAAPLGDYAYGTHLTNPYDKTGESEFDTIFSVIYNKNVMYIYQIAVDVFTKGNEIMGYDDEVKLGLYSFDEEGHVDWSKPKYESVATLDEYNGTWLGTLFFDFYEEDPFGGATQVPAIMEGDFVVAFTDFNDGDENFGIFADYYAASPYPNAYFRGVVDGRSIETQLWIEPSSLNISFLAIQPELVDLPKSVNFKNAGGKQVLTLRSNVEPDEFLYDEYEGHIIPDWVKITGEGVYDEEDYYANQMKLTIEVAENAEPRSDSVTLDVLGRKYKFLVAQGSQLKVDKDSVVFGKIGAVPTGKVTAEQTISVNAIAINNLKVEMQEGTYFTIANTENDIYTITATFDAIDEAKTYTDTIRISGVDEMSDPVTLAVPVSAELVHPVPVIKFSENHLALDSLAISPSNSEEDRRIRSGYVDITIEFIVDTTLKVEMTKNPNFKFGYDESRDLFKVQYAFLKGNEGKIFRDTVIISGKNTFGDFVADTLTTEIKAVYIPGEFQIMPKALDFGTIDLSEITTDYEYISVMGSYLQSASYKVKTNFTTEYFSEKESMRAIQFNFPEDTKDGLYEDSIVYSAKDALDKEVLGTLKVSATVTHGEVGFINVKPVINNKAYDIFGVEVNEKYKGFVIRNGKKSIQ